MTALIPRARRWVPIARDEYAFSPSTASGRARGGPAGRATRTRHGIEAPVPVDDGFDHRVGIGERPALPACAGGDHQGDQLPLSVGEQLEPGRVCEGASRPWIHCQTRPRPQYAFASIQVRTSKTRSTETSVGSDAAEW